MAVSAEQAVNARAPLGVSEHDMPAGWRVIVARRPDRVNNWYYHPNDDPRIAEALRKQAGEWINGH